jgi:hypothetical protein
LIVQLYVDYLMQNRAIEKFFYNINPMILTSDYVIHMRVIKFSLKDNLEKRLISLDSVFLF